MRKKIETSLEFKKKLLKSFRILDNGCWEQIESIEMNGNAYHPGNAKELVYSHISGSGLTKVQKIINFCQEVFKGDKQAKRNTCINPAHLIKISNLAYYSIRRGLWEASKINPDNIINEYHNDIIEYEKLHKEEIIAKALQTFKNEIRSIDNSAEILEALIMKEKDGTKNNN